MLKKYSPDYGLLTAALFLVAFGLMMLSSLSVHNSYIKESSSFIVEYCQDHPEIEDCRFGEGREKAAEYCQPQNNNCNDLYFKRQVKSAAIGLIFAFVGYMVPMAVWQTLAPLIFLGALILLLLVFSPLGTSYGAAQSWLSIPLLNSLQPVEVAKVAIIFYFAIWMSKKQNDIQTFQGGFLPFVILVSLMVLPVAFQPDFGAVLVLGFIAASMFFVAGGNIFQIFAGGLTASLLAWPIILSHAYIRLRFQALFFPELTNESDKYQIEQSLMGVGSGEWFGVGLGNSTQKFGWLPEIQGDFVFAGIAEEMGFIRILIFISLFFYIGIKGFFIAQNAPDRFSSLVAIGITAWIVFQALINILVALGVFPLTGLTLPFLSYGGSSLAMTLFALGVLLHISTLSPRESFSKNSLLRKFHTS